MQRERDAAELTQANPALAFQYVVDDDGLIATGPHADVGDAAARQFLESLDVILGFLRQLFEGLATRDVFIPCRHGFVDRGGVVEFGLGHRHLIVAYAVDVVGHADRDLTDAGEHIQLGEEIVGETVNAGGVAGNHGVVPATAALAARVHANLATSGLQEFAPLVEKLGGEWTCAHAGRVRLDDAEGCGDAGGADAGTDTCATSGRVGRRDEWVRAVVDIQHGGLTTFHEHVLTLVEGLV